MLNVKNENCELVEEYLYLVESKDVDSNGNSFFEISQYRKGKFWFFGWNEGEPVEKFKSFKALSVSVKE